jgi:hypothetical protein
MPILQIKLFKTAYKLKIVNSINFTSCNNPALTNEFQGRFFPLP